MTKKKVLITGAAKRIGLNLAHLFASLDYDLILHYNKSEQLILDEIENIKLKFPNIQIDLIQYDFSNIDNLESYFSQNLNKHKQIDVLVNNASVFWKDNSRTISIKEAIIQNNINYIAPLILTKYFGNNYKNSIIINFLDTRISKNPENYLSYSISKQSLYNLTKISALELAPNIRVNGIAPGICLPPEDDDSFDIDREASKTPLQTICKLEDINNAVKFILTNNNITGQCIFCDSGSHLK
ncbi:MAG: SDR family oxidoreductase [Marinifilaceae bacterium]|jgi:NAD(P)-dependent dehydrogenase (short-subunit alcohol dehydrogenase family)|nr:SDR family oxidoreductase [Marinifilaceae bacterium]